MGVADGNCQGIGGIIRFGCFSQRQYRFYHILDLRFLSGAVADNRLFYLQRRIFTDMATGLGCRQQSDSARLSDGDGRLGVVGEKKLLDRDLGWAEAR